MAKKIFTTGKVYGNETEYRLYVDGNRIETRYDTSGDNFKNLIYNDFVHGYTTAQLRKAEEEFNYWKEYLETIKNSPIVEDNEEFLGEI